MVPLPEARTDDTSTADLTGVIRSRRRRVWRRRLIGIGIVLAVIAVAGVAWFSPVLALVDVSVHGSRLVDREEVSKSVLDDQGGAPLPQVRTSAVEKRVLERFPKVKEAAVHYGGPRTLDIEITDRTPVLAIGGADGYHLFAAGAVDLGTVDTAPKGLTVLENSGADPDPETAAAVIRFMADLRPELRQSLTTIEAKDANSLQGQMKAGEHKATVIFGDAADASLKMRIAGQLAADGRTQIDVSVPSVPVTN